MNNGTRSGPRCAALVGPYLSGKTTLLESILASLGAIARKGTVTDRSTVGDASPEARARQMSVELSVASAEYLGEQWSFIDCPGSIELFSEAQRALMAADVAVVVCEPAPEKAILLAPLFKFLDDNGIPHLLFINKLDQLTGSDLRVRDVIEALQAVSQRPLVLRQVPIRDGQTVTGYVDLVSERAYRYRPGKPSELVSLPEPARAREQTARQEMLEALADFDDVLLEQLLEELSPETGEVYRQLSKDLAEDLIVPVFLGAADRDHGVRRLMKALRHECPSVDATADRLGLPREGTVAQVFKSLHAAHQGKLSLVRIWRGAVADGTSLGGERVSGVFRLKGGETAKLPRAEAGEVVALGRLEKAATGDLLTEDGRRRHELWPDAPQPVHGLAVEAEQRTDEVKLTAAIAKLVDEDPSLVLLHDPGLSEMVLQGQGGVHLQIALDRLRNRYNVPVRTRAPQVPYRETVRKGVTQHARFKRQSGGHGQFADVELRLQPQGRGEGFRFVDSVVGGAIPRNFIPAVEEGALDALKSGPLGFQVVDVMVELITGQFHSVDSSEQAFRTAGRMAVQEALTKCEPALLEPVMMVTLTAPTEFTAKVQRLVTGRRGQILGFDVKAGWAGWDEVRAYMPLADIQDLIVELRSLTLGLGTYQASFDHLAELSGRLADRVVEARHAGVAAQ
jgi:elongation factor G